MQKKGGILNVNMIRNKQTNSQTSVENSWRDTSLCKWLSRHPKSQDAQRGHPFSVCPLEGSPWVLTSLHTLTHPVINRIASPSGFLWTQIFPLMSGYHSSPSCLISPRRPWASPLGSPQSGLQWSFQCLSQSVSFFLGPTLLLPQWSLQPGHHLAGWQSKKSLDQKYLRTSPALRLGWIWALNNLSLYPSSPANWGRAGKWRERGCWYRCPLRNRHHHRLPC